MKQPIHTPTPIRSEAEFWAWATSTMGAVSFREVYPELLPRAYPCLAFFVITSCGFMDQSLAPLYIYSEDVQPLLT